MTPNKLRSLVAAYLKRPVADFVVEGVDLILEALNSARKDVELEQDWELAKAEVDVEVDPVNGYTFDPDIANIKSLRDAAIVQANGSLRPIKIYSKDSQAQKEREQSEDVEFDDELRYPSDRVVEQESRRTGIYQIGQAIYLYPRATVTGDSVTVRLTYNRWMPDYTGEEEDGDEDFFCVHGKSYLQWAAIVECNMFAKEFVPRQEGNLTTPEAKVEAAKAKLIAWNDFILETGRVPELR